jgi:hypothetical protein
MTSRQARASKVGQAWNANLLGVSPARPGGIARARSAASIGIVPAPQNGSTTGESNRHPEAWSIAAASVSRSGAFAVA